MPPRSLSARLWDRLGLATTRATSADAAGLHKRLDRCDKRAERVRELLEQHHTQIASLTAAVNDLQASVARLSQAVDAAGDRAAVLALARKHDLESIEAVSGMTAELERGAEAIEARVERAVARSVLSIDPFPHVVIDKLLPAEFFRILLEELPPHGCWRSSGRSRDYWEVDSDVAPWRTELVWRFVDRRVVDGMLRPRLVQAFSGYLASYWRDIFGVDPACVRYRTAESRLQLRRKGYQLRAHLDPPHAALTGLFYLARPGDDPRYGTTLYRSSAPYPLRRRGIYYPEDHGITLETTATVPFRANTLLVWMTALGAHGADLTAPDVPKSIERCTYQFQFVIDDETRQRIKAG
jgi:uncharacterized protein YoxC